MFPNATRERAAANESWQLIWGIRNFLECVRSVEWSSGISLSRRQRERESEWERGSKIAQKCAERARELNIERAAFSLSTFFGESMIHRHIVHTYDICCCSVLHFVHLSFWSSSSFMVCSHNKTARTWPEMPRICFDVGKHAVFSLLTPPHNATGRQRP